ncbi:MAG: HAD-IC family P-type ATPase [Clostridia bacterium]|nr:HAD-IC family P-type ATPase [Clostridia bacterium]
MKRKMNTGVFFGFLAFMSLLFFVFSFLFDGAVNVIFISVSFVFGLLIPIVDFLKNKEAYIRINPAMYAVASLITFIFVSYYQGLLLLLLYCLGVIAKEFVCRTKIRAEHIISQMKKKKYHLDSMGVRHQIDAKDIYKKDIVEMLSGEIVPVDGTVLSGDATVTSRTIDGMTNAYQVREGDFVLSGTTVLSGNFIIRAESDFENSTTSQTVSYKNKVYNSITAHEKMVLSLINIISLAVALIAFIIFGVVSIIKKDVQILLYGLVWISFVSCTDLIRSLLHNAYVNASMRCCNNGIVVKNKELPEKSMFIKNLLFRKQGVLTTRKPVVSKIVPVEGVSKTDLIRYAAYAQCNATHTISREVVERYKRKIKREDITYFIETEENGAMVQLSSGLEIITGTSGVLEKYDIISGIISEDSVLCVAVNNTFVGHIVFKYELKDDIKQSVESLKYAGAKNLYVITRDSERVAKQIAAKTGIKGYICELDSKGIEDTVNKFGKNTVYVGFGKGDSYDFNKECVKLMYGGFCYDTERTDGLLLSDSFGCILKYFNIIKDTRRLVLQNILLYVAALGGLLGLLLSNMYAVLGAGFIVNLGMLINQLNTLRILKKL